MFAFFSGGSGGYPDVSSIAGSPAGLSILGNLNVGGNVVATASLESDNGSVTTVPGGGIAIDRTDDVFLALSMTLINGSSGTEIGLYLRDGANIPRLVCSVNADGSIKSAQGIGTHGVDPQATARTLAQSVITSITDANAKTAIQAIANALSDTGPLTLT